MQVYELADELGVRSIDVIDAARQAGVQVHDAGSALDASQVDQVRAAHRDRMAAAAAVVASPQFVAPPPLVPTQAPPGVAPPLPTAMPTGPPEWPVAPGFAAPPPPGGMPPGMAPGTLPGQVPPAFVTGPPMHPLVKKAIWQFALAHVVPCIGLYWFFAANSNAAKGRRQIVVFRGRWGGDAAAIVIQVLFWIELVLTIALVAYALGHPSQPASPYTTVPR